jgi:N6-adenosine-specific RNA methylase IME4
MSTDQLTHENEQEVPPRPKEVIDDERYQYQALTDLTDDEYAALAADIRENGVLVPVIVDDSTEQVIIDGHHREAIAQYYDLPEEKQPSYVTLNGGSDREKLARGIKQNFIGRDTDQGVKTQAVEYYLEVSWDRTANGDLIRTETDTEIAERLGVTRQLVNGVVNNANSCIIYHDRVKAREYYEANPDASYRDVAQQVSASRPTVTEWLKEDFDKGDDEKDESAAKPALAEASDEDDQQTSDVKEIFETKEEQPDRPDGEVDDSTDPEPTESPDPPEAQYDVVYADPPWRYDFSKTSSRQIENQYQTMSLSEIKTLDVPAGEDAVLYLWATAPKLPQAMEVLDLWGFDYTTNIVWDKEQMGMGYWSRVQHELLLIGTRGDVSPPETGDRRRSVIREQRGEHSTKPETVADMISAQHSGADLIELFARDERDGWDVWGNEATPEVADD